jgi:hypothetical protein
MAMAERDLTRRMSASRVSTQDRQPVQVVGHDRQAEIPPPGHMLGAQLGHQQTADPPVAKTGRRRSVTVVSR